VYQADVTLCRYIAEKVNITIRFPFEIQDVAKLAPEYRNERIKISAPAMKLTWQVDTAPRFFDPSIKTVTLRHINLTSSVVLLRQTRLYFTTGPQPGNLFFAQSFQMMSYMGPGVRPGFNIFGPRLDENMSGVVQVVSSLPPSSFEAKLTQLAKNNMYEVHIGPSAGNQELSLSSNDYIEVLLTGKPNAPGVTNSVIVEEEANAVPRVVGKTIEVAGF
jgi:hypothetical protein